MSSLSLLFSRLSPQLPQLLLTRLVLTPFPSSFVLLWMARSSETQLQL